MVHWVGNKLKALGAELEYADVGMQELPNGSKIKLPPVLLGTLGNDPNKKTLLIYGHLDVQPAAKEDGWDYEPFVVRTGSIFSYQRNLRTHGLFQLTRDNGRLYGRGSTDDKGPVLGWIHALQGFKACGMELPLNLKFCFEGMKKVIVGPCV